MHEIDYLSPPVKSMVRDRVFYVLTHFATNGNYGPIKIKELFLMVADELVSAGIVDRPEFLRGKHADDRKFIQMLREDEPQSFPDYELPRGVPNLIRQTIWELYSTGILAPATRESININSGVVWMFFDAFVFTPYGVQILNDSKDRICVYDPDGYITNFTSASPAPDSEMMIYFQECLSVFRGGHLFATVILLAISSERLIEVLAENLRDALGEPRGEDWYKNKFANKRDISTRFKSLKGKLMHEYGDELEKEKLIEGFHSVVTLSFEAIRLARNDIAHLAEREFTWNEVSGLLHNFVQYFIYVNRIIALLAENPKSI